MTIPISVATHTGVDSHAKPLQSTPDKTKPPQSTPDKSRLPSPTVGQQRALEMINRLIRTEQDRPFVGILRGFAGTGKTTCLRTAIELFGRPVLLAPTGKAALRISEVTGCEASTLHRWMYKPEQNPVTGVVSFYPKETWELEMEDVPLLVVDEASMVGRELWESLLEAAAAVEANILLIGDPFQLPPVEGGSRKPFSVLTDDFSADFRVDLTEVMRQALDSPIIRASLALREGNLEPVRRLLPTLPSGDEAWRYTAGFYEPGASGVVLCHRNQTRHALNQRTRARLNLTGEPIPGEPLLVLRNCYEADVYNGEIISYPGMSLVGERVPVEDSYKQLTATAKFGVTKVKGCTVVLSPDMVQGVLQGMGMRSIAEAARESLGRKFPESSSLVPILDVNYGYALTAHKSQGSEWEQALVVVESSIRLPSKDGLRWLYTAVTRARKEVRLYWSASA